MPEASWSNDQQRGCIMQLAPLKTLVLNADMQPLSWGPLSVWPWQDALVAVMQGRVVEVACYEDVSARSPSNNFRIPSVVALKNFHRRRKSSFTRYHVFLRDMFRCQYCGTQFTARDLTFDHVVPRSKGGATNWNNIVTCCERHNLLKANKSLKECGMTLLRPPYEPTPYQLDVNARKLPHGDNLHVTWTDYLYWDAELEA